jgi:hypothetical protein
LGFLEPNSWEEVGDEQPTFPLFNQGHFEAKGEILDSFWMVLESRDAEAKPSQSQFEAEKLLRRRCYRTISESSGHPFQVP